jgi:hypothetical protein
MRFASTEEGRKQKANHLDWHFKTNSRVADSQKSAVNRSWYIDERVSYLFLYLHKALLTVFAGMD